MQTFMLVMISITWVIVTLAICMNRDEDKEVKMNCEDCKFSKIVKLGLKEECTKNPKPAKTNDGKCASFIKRRMK